MLGHVAYLLQLFRLLGQRFFLQFGLHCATHQMRIILISCVVITSLFYPALAMYSSSQPKSLSIVDAFSTFDPTSWQNIHNDLINIWSEHEVLREHEDSVSITTCGVGRTLRVERILIQSPISEEIGDDEDGALNSQILLSTLELERRLETSLTSSLSPCLKRSDGHCFTISPLAFWNYDKDQLLSDSAILDTLSKRNTTIFGVPVTPAMVLAGRGSYDHHVTTSRFDFAKFLAVTYFFPESDCVDKTGHLQWEEAVRSAASQNANIEVSAAPPTIIALEYDVSHSQNKGWSALSAFPYIAYVCFFAYVAWSMRHMDALHDRIGVTFTALVEITVSTITSLSVCALVGFQVTLVPWELLPIVIAFVGAENMFNLVDAVGRTSVTLSVKQRIAQGLSHAGTSNTLKVICYNCILGIISIAGSGAIRQFCAFAIVVLVAHWFLAHTFFMAVLSIDIQRLELEELLRRDTTLVPSLVRHDSGSSNKPQSGWAKYTYSIKRLLKGRAATNISLVLLLAITATLYYTTYSTNQVKQNNVPLGAVMRNQNKPTDTLTEYVSAAWQVWKTLVPENTTDTKLLHVRIEKPLVVTLNPGMSASHPPRGFRFMKTFRLATWLLKIMVLPIAATTGLLWLLLLYLLKNAELLEAQKPHSGSEAIEFKENEQTLEGHASFSTLPRAFASDVELLASSHDGHVIVSIGLHNELIIWDLRKGTHASIDTTSLLLSSPSSSHATVALTRVAVEENGMYFAAGTGTGAIAVWRTNDLATPCALLSLKNSSSSVTDLQFNNTVSKSTLGNANDNTLRLPDSPDSEAEDNVVILAIFENKIAAKWPINDISEATYLTPTQPFPIANVSFFYVPPANQILVAFAFDDGSLELVETGDTLPIILPNYHISPGSPDDIVSKVHACRSELNSTTRLVVATTTESGVVSLWDGSTGECVSVLDEVQRGVNNLRITPVRCETCHHCGQLPLDSVSIAFSVDYTVRIFQLYLKDQTRRCSCTRTQLKHMTSSDQHGLRSRSNSGVSSAISSPLIPKARLATAFESPAFPVSGHGIHSRRASDKDGTRRSSEFLTVPLTSDDHDSGHLLSPLDGACTPMLSPPSFWRNATVVMIMEVKCERGGWDVIRNKYIGIRRKPRPQGTSTSTKPISKSVNQNGLTNATLERWELWTFDPALTLMRNSLLTTLRPSEDETPASSPTCSSPTAISRLPFTKVSPLHTTSSNAMAGFGNTIGIFQLNI